VKFVDVKNDVAFRKIFGNENRKVVLISFLNAVLLLENDRKIVAVEILTPYQLPALRGGKVTIVDIRARDQNDKSYIVEMQVAEVEGFDKRVLYYASKSYSSQIDRGDLYEKLNPVFFIGILDFMITQNLEYISRHKIVDIQTGENVIADVEFTFIELPKFTKTVTDLRTIIDQWVYFIKNAENLDVIPDDVRDEGLKSAYEDAAKHNWTKMELEAYDYVLMREQDERGLFSLGMKRALKQGLEKGIQQGLEQGIKKGIEQGIQKGIEQGIQKGIEQGIQKGMEQGIQLEKEKIARNLLAVGILTEIVAQSSGLSVEEIQRIANT
jgi:predicted transposase/invertase (TIGR01784 family)